MKSANHGIGTSEVEIRNVSQDGVLICINGSEYFMNYSHFPWFRCAKLEEIFEVKLLRETHLYWPTLDVDLELEAIKHPEDYPLISR